MLEFQAAAGQARGSAAPWTWVWAPRIAFEPVFFSAASYTFVGIMRWMVGDRSEVVTDISILIKLLYQTLALILCILSWYGYN